MTSTPLSFILPSEHWMKFLSLLFSSLFQLDPNRNNNDTSLIYEVEERIR
jgi:hypothetical protein